MMASDSDESDYEDARQHHDNEVDDGSYPFFNPVATSSSSNSSAVFVSIPGESREESDDRQRLEQSASSDEQQPERIVIPPVIQDNGNEQAGIQEDNEIIMAEENNDLEQIADHDVNEEAQRVLFRLQGYFQDNPNPNPIVVDSDEDDAATISDDSELDFPLLNAEEDGESRGTSEGNDTREGEVDEELQDFDQELPIRHSYLGEGMEELQGRVLLEEDATPEIPLIAMGIHLIPGQTLPLTIFHAVFQNAIRRCVMTDRLFGIVHNDMDMPTGNVVYKGALGTLAEIFEYQEESEGNGPGSMSSSFALKAKGRQRFNVLDVRRQADGNLLGRVKIRPEIRLDAFVLNILLPGASRCFLPYHCEEESPTEDATASLCSASVPASPALISHERSGSVSQISRYTLARRDSIASTVSVVGKIDKDLIYLKSKTQSQRKRCKYYSAFTPHPYFVYEHYDEVVLVEKVHRLLKTELKGLTESRGKIPLDASDLSFWLAQNLTMDDSHRTKILKMDSPIQRLRYELELLGRTTKVISCRNCQTNIADHSQIFSMSIEGPQGTYVNPHGFVHETLTVYKAKELVTRGMPSTEASWFPGYSWTIVECKRCKSHIGWKFQAVGKLKPARFWGLARRSVIFKYDFGSDSDIQETLDTHRTPPNSANSEAFSTVALF